MLVVISGLPGTGKTAVAAELARLTGSVHLSIDTVENALVGAGIGASWTTGVAAYEAVGAVAEQNLALGRTVVVDAVNDSQAARDTWHRAAAAADAPLTFFLLTLDDAAEHRRRLETRRRDLSNISEPTWGDVCRRANEFEPWVGAHERISAEATPSHIAATVAARLGTRRRC